MLSKSELRELKRLTTSAPTDPGNLQRMAQILSSRIVDQGEHAEATKFVVGLLTDLVRRHSRAKDKAAIQLYWGIMAAIAAMGERIIEEAPDS